MSQVKLFSFRTQFVVWCFTMKPSGFLLRTCVPNLLFTDLYMSQMFNLPRFTILELTIHFPWKIYLLMEQEVLYGGNSWNRKWFMDVTASLY